MSADMTGFAGLKKNLFDNNEEESADCMAVLRLQVGGNDLWITQMGPEVNTAFQTGFAGLIRVHPFILRAP